jgi:hypothetical protein
MSALRPDEESLVDGHERYELKRPSAKLLCALIRRLDRALSEAHALIALQARVCEEAEFLWRRYPNTAFDKVREALDALSALRDAGKDGAN